MLVGAVAGFSATLHSGSAGLGLLAALAAGMAMALVFAITAKQPSDMLVMANFSPLLLAIPVYAVAQRLGGVATVRAVTALALLGCVVALAVGIYTVFVLNFERADGYLTGSLIYARLALLLGSIQYVAGLLTRYVAMAVRLSSATVTPTSSSRHHAVTRT